MGLRGDIGGVRGHPGACDNCARSRERGVEAPPPAPAPSRLQAGRAGPRGRRDYVSQQAVRSRHFRRSPRRACGSVRASVYFRPPPPPPRAEGRACRAAGPEQPWTGSWGEWGGGAGGPGRRGALRAAQVRGVGPGRSGPAGRGAAPQGRGGGRELLTAGLRPRRPGAGRTGARPR